MIANTFQNRLMAFFGLLIAAVLVTTFIAVISATRGSVERQARDDLATGSRLFERLMEIRGEQLLETTAVLAADFAFREAVATGDDNTVRSALANHGNRIGADITLLLKTDGTVRLSSIEDALEAPLLGEQAFAEVREQGQGSFTVALDGGLYQVVVVPVLAPVRIGWVAMGFAVDAELAEELRFLTGLEVTFIRDQSVLVSTLPEATRGALLNRLRDTPEELEQDLMYLDGEEYLGIAMPFVDDASSSATGVLLQAPLSEALAVFHGLRMQLLVIATLALLITLLAGAFIARGVTRPVRELGIAARRIERGNYMQPLSLDGGDELGELATAFTRMQKGIADREERILHMANHDSLTGLPNRTLAQDRLRSAIRRARRDASQLAVLMIDINRFKEINDTLGHQVGDQALRHVALHLASCLRESDTVARLGGDEFLVLLEHCDEAHACAVARDLVAITSSPVEQIDNAISIELSVGVAMFPEHGEEEEQLMRRADIAMYEAKTSAEHIAVYQAGRDEVHLQRLTLLRDLRVAVDEGQFRLMFQPKVCMRTDRVIRVETLIRWQHPEQGMVPPDEFIFLAEQAGLITRITRWVLAASIERCSQWRREQGTRLALSVNISAIDLFDESLPGYIEELLEKHEMAAGDLILEITESAVMTDVEHAKRMLLRLQAVGIKLSVDDFGTGHSSLSQLKQLPVDEIKIDKSFVMQLAEGTDDAIIVRSTIDLGHNMGLEVVAEGVENAAGWSLLSSYRCDVAQGYLISKPLPADDFIGWFRDCDGNFSIGGKV